MASADQTGASAAALSRREQLATSRRALLERMVEIRVVEDTVLDLFAQGHIAGTTHTAQGQEGVAVGIALALKSDHVVCTYRGHGMALALGITPGVVLGEILGRRTGSMSGLGGSMHLCDPSIGLLPTSAIVGAGMPIATGAALASQVLGKDAVALAVFGDGAANIGAFHEALNLAAIWSLPTVFVCENNLYGEYSRIDTTTPVADLAMRADSYGMPSQIVDGQDADAVSGAVAAAARRAREGCGPTFIEAKTYRYAGHSRSDQGTYRPEGELAQWTERDPITILGHRLIAERAVTASDVDEIWTAQRASVQQAVTQALAAPRPEVEDMFGWVLATGR